MLSSRGRMNGVHAFIQEAKHALFIWETMHYSASARRYMPYQDEFYHVQFRLNPITKIWVGEIDLSLGKENFAYYANGHSPIELLKEIEEKTIAWMKEKGFEYTASPHTGKELGSKGWEDQDRRSKLRLEGPDG